MKLKAAILLISLCTRLALGSDFPQDEFSVKDPNRPRSIFWPQFTSILLPGFDQYWERQYPYALSYSGIAILGQVIANANRYDKDEVKKEKKDDFDERDYGYAAIGNSMTFDVGLFSAYHSFRSAARTRPGDFSFIKANDSIKDVLLAPFQFSYLKRWTTYVPLGLLTTLLIARAGNPQRHVLPFYERLASTGSLSYGAGVTEEAAFRGWLMPVLHYEFNSALLGNLSQGLLFGAAHISEKNRTPVIQTVSGIFDGWVSQRNGYSICEGVFGHFWWDVLVFGTILVRNASTGENKMPVWLPTITVPLG